jgi:hypothetical protein
MISITKIKCSTVVNPGLRTGHSLYLKLPSTAPLKKPPLTSLTVGLIKVAFTTVKVEIGVILTLTLSKVAISYRYIFNVRLLI